MKEEIKNKCCEVCKIECRGCLCHTPQGQAIKENLESMNNGLVFNPKTPQEVLSQAREEFKKRFIYLFDEYDVNKKDLLDWHTSTLQAFIEAEIEHLEGMERKPELDCCGDIESCEYNKALQDQISHLKGIIK